MLETMYSLLTRKKRADVRQVMAGLLKALALPPAILLLFAAIVATVATVNGLSGAEFAGAFIGESAAPVATVMGAVLLFVYLGAAMFFVLPSLQAPPSLQDGGTAAGVAVARFLGAIAQRILQAIIPWQAIPAAVPPVPGHSLDPPARQRAEYWAEPYSKGQNPERE